MKTGDIICTNKIEHRGFSNKDAKFAFKAKPGRLLTFLYLGGVSPDSAPHFSPDGALAAMGYGPIALTLVQRKLVDALKVAGTDIQHVLDGGSLPDAENTLQLVDAALLAAANFTASSAPTIDPLMLDAARMDKVLRILASKIGACNVLSQLLGSPDIDTQGLDERQALEAVIDAAVVP